RNEARGEKFWQDVLVERGSNGSGRERRLDFGREEQLGVRAGVVQGLDSEPIAREGDALAGPIPDGEGKHAVKMFDRAVAFLLVQMKDGFRVAPRSVLMAAGLQAGPQIRMVVDLAVEDDPHRAVFVVHRLLTGADVDD